MTCHEETLIYELLHSQEGIAEVLSLYSRNIATHLIQSLEEGRATECEGVIAEVDVVEQAALIVYDNGRYHLLHIRYLTTS